MSCIRPARLVLVTGVAVVGALLLASCAPRTEVVVGKDPAASPSATSTSSVEPVALTADDWGYFEEAANITVVDGVSPEDAVGILYGESGEPQLLASLDVAQNLIWDSPESGPYPIWVAAGMVDGHTFVWEDNGFAASLARGDLAGSGRAASMYWSVNYDTAFVYAESDTTLLEFEAIFPPSKEQWKQLGSAGATTVTDAEWDIDPIASGLSLQADLFNLSAPADPSWLSLPGTTFWSVLV